MISLLTRLVVLFLFTLPVLSGTYAASAKIAVYRNFWQPYYHGVRLNHCLPDAKTCGLPVATYYCQLMGYAKADQQIIANNVGLTRFLQAPDKSPMHLECRGWRCNGFKTIRCVGEKRHQPPKTYHYRKRRFVFPRYNHYRVAYCYDGDKGCGRRVATSFCRRMGYMQSLSFHFQNAIAATQAIGNQKLCFGGECRAFAYIDCFR